MKFKISLIWLLLLILALVLAAPNNNKKPNNNNDEDEGTISSFFSSIIGFIQNGISTLFGLESRNRNNNLNGKRVNYRSFQLMRAVPLTPDQLNEIKGLEEDFEGVKFWRAPRFKNSTVDFQVPPDQVETIKDFFRERQIDFTILNTDIQSMISDQNPKMTKERRDQLKDATGHTMTWRRYHRYVDIAAYLDYLSSKYPDMVTLERIGKSYGGIPLRVIKITASSSNNAKQQQSSNKSAIWIDGGSHAREWISPAVATYIIKQLVENYQVNKQLLDNFDFYILPVLNPDGYEYSHTTDRLWRKTRSSTGDEEGRRIARIFFGSCEGVDPNRNWDYHWGEKGASDDPCDETYAGTKAFSEPETRAVADFILQKKNQIKVYLTLHSYGQLWLLPWGYTKEKLVDHDDLMKLGQTAIQALAKVQGTQFNIGPATQLLYHSAGGSDDWAKGAAGIKYAYTVELRDQGDYGFLLPAGQIISTGKETFAAIKAMVKDLMPVKTVIKRPSSPTPSAAKKPKPQKATAPIATVVTSTTESASPRGKGRITQLKASV